MSTTQHSPSASAVISASKLCKSFDETVAVDGLDLEVQAGEILALLGPNGAGKTTTVRMLTTLLAPDSGSAMVAGWDVATRPRMVRQTIGLAGQASAVDQKLTARENLDLFGRLYHLSSGKRVSRVEELIDHFRLGEFADRPVATYSGGEQRRLDLAAALLANPPALFLDEPTTGLDPRSRREVWDEIRLLASRGTAVVLTTQYLDEADQLADRIVLIDRGRIVASGTPAQLKNELKRDVLQITVASAKDLGAAATVLADPEAVTIDETTLHVPVAAPAASLAMLRKIEDAGIPLEDFQLRKPTLDDVFLALTDLPTSQTSAVTPRGATP